MNSPAVRSAPDFPSMSFLRSRTLAVATSGQPWLVVALCSLLAAIAYHPYYFGDEIQAFFFAMEGDGNFLHTYQSFNDYKPRLIFYAFWAGLAAFDLPRAVAAVATMAALVGSAQIVSHVIQVHFNGTRRVALLGALVVITSRFTTVAYHDYLSGTIEAFALFLFLLVVALSLPLLSHGRPVGSRRGIVLVSLAIATIFIHERYVAAYVAVGFMLAAASVFRPVRGQRDLCSASWGILLAILPAIAFATATWLVAEAPITTGTGGRQVSLDSGMIRTTLKYCFNVLVGTNFGQVWLVGDAGFPGKRSAGLFAGLSVVAALLWMVPLVTRSFLGDWRRVVFLATSMLSLCAVASLPGIDHLEGRWLTPVLPLAVLLACACGRGWSRALIVSALLVFNVAYAVIGSHDAIYNVSTSRSINSLASGLESMSPGRNGILLNVPAPDYAWSIGGNSFGTNAQVTGAAFCKYNLRSGACIQPPTPELLRDMEQYDFAVTLRATDPKHPSYKLLSRDDIGALRSPDEIDLTALRPLLEDPTAGWRWSAGIPAGSERGVVGLAQGNVGTRIVPVQELGPTIVYRVEAPVAGVEFRVQVNWADREGRFLGTSFNVASSLAGTHNYVGVLTPPPTAVSGEVYATLHDGETDSVRLLGVWSGNR